MAVRNMVVTSGALVMHHDPDLICHLCGQVIQVGEYFSYEGRRLKKNEAWHSLSKCPKKGK